MIDAHVHVWDPARLDYPWLADAPVLQRAFLPADIDRGHPDEGESDRDDRSAVRATARMVFVQAGCRSDQALDEVRWVLGLADVWPELAAIVADADLRSGTALERHLDALAAISDRGPSLSDQRSKGRRVGIPGVRHLLQDEPDELLHDRASRTALLDGLRMLAHRGLTFDLCVRHPQLGSVVAMLEEVPGLRVVLDHVGKPPVDAGIDTRDGRAWADAIDRMARLPSAHVKLSGLAAEASDTEVLDANAGAFLAHAITAFGPDRAMLGSDWPVSALTGATGTFAGWRERVRRAAHSAGVDVDGVASIEAGTASRFYALA
ncbi:amidohydrolase family protein [Planctomonas sp. JC2975]|uniref:amidohydrolase family protein n=1 Tax=Planctomonas sp. JC2975 TaxID=2729626 RepID=UPI00147448D3|nr:amidohydrolase family protein [Planctomonas sp. JC2975]